MPGAFHEGPILNSPCRRQPGCSAIGATTSLAAFARSSCQIEAVETAIWLTEVAPDDGFSNICTWRTSRRTPVWPSHLNTGEVRTAPTASPAEGGDRRRRLGDAAQRHLPPLPPARFRRIAVKVINRLGDEAMKVFRV